MTDPKDEIEALKRRIAELEALQAAQADPEQSTRIKTDGGAAIGGGVRVANGHFIGRDYVASVTHIVQSGESQADAEHVVGAYLQLLTTELSTLHLGEIDGRDHGQREALQLRDVYVPLNTTLRINAGYDLHEWLTLPVQLSDRTLIDRQGHAVRDKEYRPVSVLEALAEHKVLTLLGKPGSGKTSFGARMLLALVEALSEDKSALAHLGERWPAGALFPIRVVLREFADQLPAGDAPACAGDVWDFIGRRLRDNGVVMQAGQIGFLQRFVVRHGALVVFDGLDECGGDARRARVQAAVDGFMRSCGERSRFVLTARPYAFPGGQDPSRGVYLLADFDDDQIEDFIRRWYEVLPQRRWCLPIDAERKCADLLVACARPALRALTPNPLLLTLMAVLHYEQGHVPGNRAELYDESVKLLLQRWNRKSGSERALCDAVGVPDLDLSEVRRVLQQLAFDVHASSMDETEGEGDLDIGENALLQAFRPLLQQSLDKAEAVVEYIEHRTGLLLSLGLRVGERRFSFPHRTFREYLAACHLTESDDFDGECLRLARADPDHWAQVLPLAGRIAGLPRAANAADELIGGERIEDHRAAGKPISAVQWKCAAMAGLMLREQNASALQSNTGKPAAVLRRVRHWLAAALPVHPDEGGLPISQRAKMGEILNDLGDIRFNPENFYFPEDGRLGLIMVASDSSFYVGTRSGDVRAVEENFDIKVPKDEVNDVVTPVGDFWISKYPVTAGQFRLFFEETGIFSGDIDSLYGLQSSPMTGVNWFESVEYIKWISNKALKLEFPIDNEVLELIKSGAWIFDLPSEIEWERACFGGRARALFPWGNHVDYDRVRRDGCGVGEPFVVGLFPSNELGLFDMIGGFWEWTRSIYGKYPGSVYVAARHDSNSRRVLRGGSWSYGRAIARCSSRYRLPPQYRRGAGFRIVLRRTLPALDKLKDKGQEML
ncbi:SUMF1/EgtB/PvdO family nonheme iron enzyme [Lysobacter hankyongensis]|uniref:NACHT domain-containing protein n=1 Tax=Lysobacter hankyongensis TaxID=1176535 RepID=A0ABP9AQ43_9GAMM